MENIIIRLTAFGYESISNELTDIEICNIQNWLRIKYNLIVQAIYYPGLTSCDNITPELSIINIYPKRGMLLERSIGKIIRREKHYSSHNDCLLDGINQVVNHLETIRPNK
jgi:hypothetical protein